MLQPKPCREIAAFNRCLYLTIVAVLLCSTPARGDIRAIRKDKLPQDPSVLKTLAEVSAVEPMVDHWSPEWRYQTPKKEVAARLQSSLETLKKSLQASPDNEELLLFTGLVAHYSYNLDTKGSYELAADSFNQAQKLAPKDFRPMWFLGLNQCQSYSETVDGMKKFLALENSENSQQLPAAFWDDYLQCASVTNMPAHGLRAGSRANALDAQPSSFRTALLQALRERFLRPDPAAKYPAKQVWLAENSGASTVFTSFLFGMRFSSPSEWRLNLPDVQKAFGMAQFETGPYRGNAGQVVPNILVIVRPPKPDETLQDFLSSVTKEHGGSAVAAPACPAQHCLAWQATKAHGYGAEGDGHMIVTVLERDAPEFPGVLFEEPTRIAAPNDSKVHDYRLDDQLARFSGKLYYLVLLDTAASVLQPAEQAYLSFLKNMQVE